MNTDLRRSKRYDEFLTVSVLAHNEIEGMKTGPIAARIINVSTHGACLLMSHGTLQSNNIYPSTIENESFHIEILGKIPSEGNNFSFKARPVWMSPFVLDDIQACTMGVDIIATQDQQHTERIINMITTEQNADSAEHMDAR